MANLPPAASSHYDALFKNLGFSETHRYLLRQIPAGSDVLELGPASGYMTQILAEQGCRVDAIELNPQDAAKAAPYCRRMIVGSVEDAANFAELPGPYHVILMADVLEHLRQPEYVLQLLRPRLAPDGIALASLPNIAFWKMRLQLLRGRFEYTDTGLLDRTHLRFFTLQTAVAMFRAAGFRVTEMVVPPREIPHLGKLKMALMKTWPAVFSINMVYHLRVDAT
jgi:2-polyprenyl-3-methyl-5-hydroxy-6-metoxy-1,4-benzoquinol methylase